MCRPRVGEGDPMPNRFIRQINLGPALAKTLGHREQAITQASTVLLLGTQIRNCADSSWGGDKFL